mgnify:FL=1
MTKNLTLYLFIVCILLQSCKEKAIEDQVTPTINNVEKPSLFTLLPESETNITFQNTLKEGLNANVLVSI